MRKTIRICVVICTLLFVTAHVRAQQPKADNHPVVPAATPKAIAAMPVEYSRQIDALQAEAKKNETDYAQVIGLYKDYVAKQVAIQAEITKQSLLAALEAHVTIDQLKNSDLVKDEKTGNWEWREKAKPVAVPSPK